MTPSTPAASTLAIFCSGTPAIIILLLGNSVKVCEKRYAHLQPDSVRDAVSTLVRKPRSKGGLGLVQ